MCRAGSGLHLVGVAHSLMLEVCDSVLLCTGRQGTTVVLQADQGEELHAEQAGATA